MLTCEIDLKDLYKTNVRTLKCFDKSTLTEHDDFKQIIHYVHLNDNALKSP